MRLLHFQSFVNICFHFLIVESTISEAFLHQMKWFTLKYDHSIRQFRPTQHMEDTSCCSYLCNWSIQAALWAVEVGRSLIPQ